MSLDILRNESGTATNQVPDARIKIGRDLVRAVVASGVRTVDPAFGEVRKALGLEAFDLRRAESALMSAGEISKTPDGRYELSSGELNPEAMALQGLIADTAQRTAEFDASIADHARDVVERQYFPDTDPLF